MMTPSACVRMRGDRYDTVKNKRNFSTGHRDIAWINHKVLVCLPFHCCGT